MSMVLSNMDALNPFYDITISGKRVNSDYKQLITQVEFEDSDCEASLARISVFDKDFKFSSNFDFSKGATVKLYMGYENKHRLMLTGIVSHFEADFDENGVPNLVIGAIDTSDAMTYVKKTKPWKNITRSAIVQSIAGAYGFQCLVQNTGEVHEQITQDNETDASFIKKMAEDEGFQFYVFPECKKLFFGDRLKSAQIKDSLSYCCGDCSIRSFTPSLVEKNSKKSVGGDGHKSKDKSQKSADNASSGGSGGASFSVKINDGDDGAVGIIGKTGAQKR